MATVAGIVKARKGRAGSGGSWRVEQRADGMPCWPIYTLWHYSTPMLSWYDGPNGIRVLDFSTGHGSVSDQNGMNTAFRALGLPFYFSRKGGAEIVEVAR